jgi:predicted double-glycine peptidase
MEKIQYDVERMGTLLSDIRKYSEDLDAMNIRSVEDLHDKRNF